MSQDRVKVVRQAQGKTEQGVGQTSWLSYGYRVIGGALINLADSVQLEGYAGVERSHLSRAGYAEKDIAFPVIYGDLKYVDTAMVPGAKMHVALNSDWHVSAQVSGAYSVSTSGGLYTATAENPIGSVSHQAVLNPWRGMVSVGVSYQIRPEYVLSVSPFVSRGIMGETQVGGSMSLSGKF